MKIIVLFITTVMFQNITFAQTTVTVMTYNIFHGANTNESFDFKKIARVINSVNPDLVALQEVDFNTNRLSKRDLASEIGLRTNMISLFGKAIDYDDGEYGIAILSKHEIIKWENTALPFEEGNEPRTILNIVTTLSTSDTVSFICTHLDYKPNSLERINQANKINELYTSNKYPTILAGDFNDVPNSPTLDILSKYWETTYDKTDSAKTFPSNKPDRKIDYIMFNPKDKWKIIHREVICDSIASDHCGYFTELELIK
ncbi:MAG: endonuclease/exonuclease/phosphatase family protein [Melioribacteraceae bacterium]|jgi:endonuclease/exonuclease/phosphatase family metal-dependent hydrolase|nr:endonuclease/exonuclease/phosphatase family protein [Melioribacteraceae bacterium]